MMGGLSAQVAAGSSGLAATHVNRELEIFYPCSFPLEPVLILIYMI